MPVNEATSGEPSSSRDVRRARVDATRRRRRALGLVAAAAFGAGALTAALAGGEVDELPASPGLSHPVRAKAPAQLPGGGRRLFPDYRVVAAYGSPRDPQLGMLGVGSLRSAVARLRRQMRPYERKTRPVLPALELIAVIATADAGGGELHRDRLPAAQIDRHLRVAREAGALLILDIQPGRADFMSEVRALEPWLREPDVGLALDPEWRVQQGQVPGRVIGSTAAAEVNEVSDWLADLVAARRLPEKLLIIHQFTDDMIREKAQLVNRPGLAIAFNVDGFGGAEIKRAKYEQFSSQTRPGFHDGFKLFYEEDTGLMSPRTVLALKPPPDVVVYE